MSIAGGPNIIKSGLVLELDAGNIKSYPGTGTTWFDKSSYNLNGTLVNTPSYTTENLGALGNFTTNQYVDVSSSWTSFIPTGSAERTIMMGFKSPSDFGGNYKHILHYGEATTDKAYGLDIMTSAFTGTGYAAIAVHTWAGGAFGQQALTTNTNYIGAIRYKDSLSPRNSFFLNGSFLTTGYGQGKTTDYSINTGTVSGFLLGTRISGPSELFGTNGLIYFTFVYNRWLTNNELIQNYNALKSRIGL